ncbi:MAG: MBL fold metallo-hydrolase [Brockia lithotrophica]|nr:MBL fold metallo-hydrolase [Brockia lithotrophica]
MKGELLVLGSFGAYPEAENGTAGYLLTAGTFRLLLDAGSGVLRELLRVYRYEDLSACLLSHYHFDHVADLGPLLYAQQLLRERKPLPPFPVYLPREPEGASLPYVGIPGTEVHLYGEGEVREIGPWRVRFRRTQHSVPTFAIRLELDDLHVVYTADAAYAEDLVAFARGAALLLAEAFFYAGEEDRASSRGHMTSRQAGRLAREAGVRTLVLTHLPHEGIPTLLVEEAKAEFPGEVLLASPGLRILLA